MDALLPSENRRGGWRSPGRRGRQAVQQKIIVSVRFLRQHARDNDKYVVLVCVRELNATANIWWRCNVVFE